MKNTCDQAPTNKKEYITDIGKILVAENGKKKYYKPKEIKRAHAKSKWYHGFDFSCWAMCTFASHSDFDHYHSQTGEICDYGEMKAEMLRGLSVSTNADWTDIPDLDMDSSWLDFGDVFESFLGGIGNFIGDIFDGI